MTAHLGVGPGAGTARARLQPKQVVEQTAHVVVVQQVAGGRVAHDEREHRQPRRRSTAEHHQVAGRTPARHRPTGNARKEDVSSR